MKSRTTIALFLAVFLAACSTGGDPITRPATHAPGPSEDGVTLSLQGGPGAQCQFVLHAFHAEGLARHTLPIEFKLIANDGSVAHESNFYVELPMPDVPWTRHSGEGVSTDLVDGRAEVPCDGLRGSVVLGTCHRGACPRYRVAAHSDITLDLR